MNGEEKGLTIMNRDYKVTEEITLFSGAVFDVVERTIEVITREAEELVDSIGTITRQVITYGDSVLIVPVTKDKQYMMLGEEYRTVVNGTQIGFPAGRIDDTDKTYVDAVHRELQEELGLKVVEGSQPIHLFSAHASLGYTLEQIHAYLVYVDPEVTGETSFDDDEYVELRKVAIGDVQLMLDNRVITSMSASLAYVKALAELNKLTVNGGNIIA